STTTPMRASGYRSTPSPAPASASTLRACRPVGLTATTAATSSCSPNDCTGDFQTIGSNSHVNNAQ
ncbi:hypothetical protein BG000_000195, partial [Podila horticola]